MKGTKTTWNARVTRWTMNAERIPQTEGMRRQANEGERSEAMAKATEPRQKTAFVLRAWGPREQSADNGEKARRVRSDDAQRQEGAEDGRPPARETGGATWSRKARPGRQTPANGCGKEKKSSEEPELTGTCACPDSRKCLPFFARAPEGARVTQCTGVRRDDLRALRPHPTRSGDKHSARGGRARER
ncbi:hypothetical protein ERJ75_000796000 [Trypanosoma vivax]|nr:hypothetical protein ERJ75_000796000 [Trypanosoma vivax]